MGRESVPRATCTYGSTQHLRSEPSKVRALALVALKGLRELIVIDGVLRAPANSHICACRGGPILRRGPVTHSWYAAASILK